MRELNHTLRRAGLSESAQYATLFNHRIRFMMGMNLRELQHLAELRTQPAGHFGYRGMVMEMVNAVKWCYPWTALALQFVNYDDPGNKIARAREQGYLAGRNLATGIDGSVDLVR
jgi:thymidylate synthase ThyX